MKDDLTLRATCKCGRTVQASVVVSLSNPHIDWTPEKHDVKNLKDIVQCHVSKVLAEFEGNKSRASRALGVTRNTITRILSKPGRFQEV